MRFKTGTVFLAVICAFLSTHAHAQDMSVLSYTYAPPPCEFSASLPQEPFIKKECEVEDNENEKCFERATYTKTFSPQSEDDIASNANISITLICNTIDDAVRKNYSGKVMEATLKAMTDSAVVRTFDTSFREEKHYKHAGLVGEGRAGNTPTIYIAQLWIGDKSALSLEAEITGDAHEDADTLFSSILRSVGYKAENAP